MSLWSRLGFGAKGCSPPRPLDAAFVDALAALGYFRLLDPGEAAEAKRSMVQRTNPLTVDVGRCLLADAEELAEGAVRDFLGYAAPFLRLEGVRMDVVYGPWRRPPLLSADPPERYPYPGPTQSMQVSPARGAELVACEETFDGLHQVRIGDRCFPIGDDRKPGDWDEATTATVAILSFLLEGHGSAERAWALDGGNDGSIVFATAEQAALLNAAIADPRGRLGPSPWAPQRP